MSQFDQMTSEELREYIRKHPTDDEAIRARIRQIERDPRAITVTVGTSREEI